MHGKIKGRNGRKVPAMSRTSDLRGGSDNFWWRSHGYQGLRRGDQANRGRGEDLIEK